MGRKEMKKRAKFVLRRHYVLFVVLCLAAAFIGVEFTGSLDTVMQVVEYDATEPAAVLPEEQEIQAKTPLAGSRWGLTDVLLELIENGGEGGKALSEQIQTDILQESADKNPAFGRSRGVLSSVINSLASGSFVITILSAASSVIGSENAVIAILVVLSFLAMFAVWFFVTNLYTLIARRLFLEGRIYGKISADRLLFLVRAKKWTKAAFTMLLTTVLYFLWSLTVVGGVIKRYSYFLVPYIAAENPDLGAWQTVTLSRKMMRGHKWECFVFELTFLGWYLLGLVTFGLSAILFSNPYRLAAFSEYYAELRRQALGQGLPGSEGLNDRWLFEVPAAEVLASAYGDVLELLNRPRAPVPEVKGFRGFLANVFGILLTSTPEQKAYEEERAIQARIERGRKELEGRAYPVRLFPCAGNKGAAGKPEKEESSHYLRHYTIWSLVVMFFLFAMVGWVWEVVLHLVAEHELVNRGMLYGPWLPIYGTGGVMILVVLNRFRSKPALEFALAVVLCGVVEYFTSYVTELTHNGQKWWDYSGYFLNLDGRICAEGLLVFGLGGMLVVYVLAPMLDNQIRRIPQKTLVPVCVALVFCFVADWAVSTVRPNAGKGVTEDHSAEVQAATGGGLPQSAAFSEKGE